MTHVRYFFACVAAAMVISTLADDAAKASNPPKPDTLTNAVAETPQSKPAEPTMSEKAAERFRKSMEETKAMWPDGPPNDLEGKLKELTEALEVLRAGGVKDDDPELRILKRKIVQVEIWIQNVPWRNEEWNRMSAPLQAFMLRHFDTNGDGRIDLIEWWPFDNFNAEFHDIWRHLLAGTDKNTPVTQYLEASKKTSPIFSRLITKLVEPDGDGSFDNLSPEKKQEAVTTFFTGGLVYMLRFEKQALADNDGKPGDASRAAILKAFDADMRERFRKADTNKDGQLDADEAEKFLVDIMGDFQKEYQRKGLP